MEGQITGLFSPLLERLRLKQVAKEVNGGNVLDFGCGRANLIRYLKAFDLYLGVDIDSKLIENLKKIWRDERVKFQTLGEFKSSPICVEFDYIVLSAVLEHLVNPKSEIGFLLKYLKRGGKLVITTPTPKADKILKYGSKVKLFSREAHKQHCNYFDKRAFEKLVYEFKLKLSKYRTFEFGLNQIVVFSKV